MSAGSFRIPVKIERRVGQRYDFGLDTSEWQEYRTPWAKLRPVSGGETVAGEQVQGRTTHTMEMYHDKARPILPDMRVTYAGRVFEITKVWDIDEEKHTQLLEVVECQ